MKQKFGKRDAVRVIKICLHESKENGCGGTIKKLEKLLSWIERK